MKKNRHTIKTKRAFPSYKRMGVYCGVFFFAVCFVFLGGGEALAWGPGVHMVTGNWLLQNLTSLPMPVATAIMSHPGQFLYGILSPDIFIGKGSLTKKGRSHNGQTGLLLLRLADSLEQQAYAYGYLSHLAADTVAHNVFVPQSSEASVGSGRLAHVYLEMQADRALDWDSADALAVFHERPSAASAALLQKTMRQTPWTFWMKKFLFRQSIFFGGLPSWRSAMGFFDSVIVGQEGAAFAEQMLVVSTRAMVNLLQDIKNSPVRSLDPIGADALADFRGQPLNLVQSIMGNLFPQFMQKRWSKTFFYSETTVHASHKNFDINNEISQGRDGELTQTVVKESHLVVAEEGFCDTGDIPADIEADITQKMHLLSSFDSSSPIIEKGFTLPDVLKNLPPVCVP